MGGRVGYEYRYRFWMADEILSLYKFSLSCGIKSFLFEFRTNFMIKRRPDEVGAVEIIDSERYDACVKENEDEIHLDFLASYRLKEYWMTDDEVDRLIYEAFDFAKQMAADPQHASLRVIPVVVGVEVCTVQQEGEPIGPTMDRAIRAQNLVPLYLWPFPTAVERQPINPLLINFIMKLPRIRVEDVDEGRALMRVCSICLRNPRIGTQISLLPCHHAFHSHCVVRWLENSKLCPLCHFPAHDYMFQEPRYLERNP